jgi:hypothetical protein
MGQQISSRWRLRYPNARWSVPVVAASLEAATSFPVLTASSARNGISSVVTVLLTGTAMLTGAAASAWVADIVRRERVGRKRTRILTAITIAVPMGYAAAVAAWLVAVVITVLWYFHMHPWVF